MKYIIADTETNGLFDFTKPADAEGQARLASLAIIMVEVRKYEELSPSAAEANGNEDQDVITVEAEHEFLIKPNGWVMTPETTAVNGLTTEHLLANGEDLSTVLRRYTTLIEAGYVFVAFNSQFDSKVMRGELRRAGLSDMFEKTGTICLMRASTDIVKAPKKTGKGWKFPKLSEACAFFKIEQPAAHSALGDARSALAIFRELKQRNALPAPEVHYAKTRPEDSK